MQAAKPEEKLAVRSAPFPPGGATPYPLRSMAPRDLLWAGEGLRDGGGAGGLHADRRAVPDGAPIPLVWHHLRRRAERHGVRAGPGVRGKAPWVLQTVTRIMKILNPFSAGQKGKDYWIVAFRG